MTQRQAYAAARAAVEDFDNPMTHPQDVLNDILGYDRKQDREENDKPDIDFLLWEFTNDVADGVGHPA
jgi:hypothetical protein